jgi:hypothetical protein
MKSFLFDVLKGIVGDKDCKFIAEIGTHKGGTAQQLISLFAPRVERLTYYGYDIFDGDNPDIVFHKNERNGKAPALYSVADSTLKKMQRLHSNVDYKLHKGFTTDTLTPNKFDFVYIDGGHSYETVKHDYSMVKDSSIIVFDDVKITGVNKFINELKDNGVAVEIVDTVVSKHVWAVIKN